MPVLLAAMLLALVKPALAGAKQGEAEVLLPVPIHSESLYRPSVMIDSNQTNAGAVDSGVAPGSMGIMVPYALNDGQFVILRAPQTSPQVEPAPAELAMPQATEGNRLTYLRPQQAMRQYQLEAGNPAHALILQAIAKGDDASALRSAEQASSQGDVAATRFMAAHYQYGSGAYDLSQWLRWVDRAAHQGDTAAQYELGRLYAAGVPADATGTGQPLPQNLSDAVGYLNMCWRESGDCSYALGIVGLQLGMPSAVGYIRHAADFAHPKSMLWLGKAMVEGSYGQARDPVMGAVWLRLASSSGLQEASSLYSETYAKLTDAQRKSVEVSSQQLMDRFSKGGVVRRKHAKRKQDEGFFATMLAAVWGEKVAKPAQERVSSALAPYMQP